MKLWNDKLQDAMHMMCDQFGVDDVIDVLNDADFTPLEMNEDFGIPLIDLENVFPDFEEELTMMAEEEEYDDYIDSLIDEEADERMGL